MSEKSSGRCPICEETADQKYRPFCSKRCADIDLHRWLNGSYVIAGEEDESASESEVDAEKATEPTTRLH